MAQAEVRRIVNTVGETGAADREEVVYQIGAVIDGGWVPFLTKSEGYALHLSQNNQESDTSGQSQSDAQPSAPAQASTPSDAQPTQSDAQPSDQSQGSDATPTETTNQ